MSIVGYYDQYGDYILNTDKDIEDFKVIDNIQAVEEILKGRKLTANVWNKLYKKELFQHIRFPKDVLYCHADTVSISLGLNLADVMLSFRCI